MRTRLPILLGLVLLLSAAGYAATLTEAPAAPVTPVAVADQTLAADPFLALSDITSSAPEDRTVCPCQLGVSCCGDGGCLSVDRAGEPCGINCACRCRNGQCKQPL